MFKSSSYKLFWSFLLIFASGCNFWRAGETGTASPTPFVAAEIKSEIPFATKEPEIYQALAVSQFLAADEKTERKIFTARNGARRLSIFNVGEKDEISLLELGTNQTFLIRRDKKIYTENFEPALAAENANDFLSAELLNQKTPAVFENLGTENGVSKFRVKLGNAEMNNSEVLIYIDDNLKLPVKQEFYSISGEQKTLTFSAEMKDFKLAVDENLFELPKGYRKVSSKQFQESIWGIVGNE